MSGKLQPPVNASLVDNGGSTSVPWAQYHQRQADALYAATPQIGDYLVTLTPMAGWLKCDGSSEVTATYPQLSALLFPILGAGSGSGTFKLPTITGVVDGPSGDTVGNWYVRAL